MRSKCFANVLLPRKWSNGVNARTWPGCIHFRWATDPSKVRKTGDSVIQQLRDIFEVGMLWHICPGSYIFQHTAPGISGVDIDLNAALERVFKRWKSDFDPVYAGFGSAPKVWTSLLVLIGVDWREFSFHLLPWHSTLYCALHIIQMTKMKRR